jgi:hypothetical protein
MPHPTPFRFILPVALALLAITSSAAHAQSWWCRGLVQPQISDVQYTAGGGVVVKPPIVYVAGTVLDVSLTIPDCTQVSAVHHDGHGDPSYWIQQDQSLGDGRHRVTLRMVFANAGRGHSYATRVVVTAETSRYMTWWEAQALPTAEHLFTRVDVKRTAGRMAMTVSEDELRNRFITAMFASFGPEGRIQEGSTSVRPYGPAYDLASEPTITTVPGSNVTYVPPQLALEEGKVHFAWSFNVSIPNWCDASGRVWGRFGVEVDQPSGPEGRYVFVVWEGGGPSVDLSTYPCSLIDWVVVNVGRMFGAVDREATVREQLMQQLQNMVDMAVGTCPLNAATGQRFCPRLGIDPTLLDPSVAIHKDHLTIEVFSPDTITIDVPYATRNLDTPELGLALGPGQQAIVTASGRPTICTSSYVASGERPSTCAQKTIAPHGIYNEAASNPFLYPGLSTSSLSGDESSAYRALAKVYRDPALLPLPHEKVGAVIARSSVGARPQPIVEPCTLVGSPTASSRIAFGVNDHLAWTGYELGAGSYEVHLTWPIAGSFPPPRCTYQPEGAIAGRWSLLGGPQSFLGQPLTDEISSVSGKGMFTHFEHGTLAWGGGGVFYVIGGIRYRWADLSWDRGPLGFPTSDEICTPDAACRGRLSHFEKGTITWTLSGNTRVVTGPIHDRWKAHGAEAGHMGLPLTEELAAGRWWNPGRHQDFEDGVIYHSAPTGAHMVMRGILAHWRSLASELGYLGYPLTDEENTVDGRGRFNDFQGGSIYWHPDYGTHAIHGSIRDYWLSQGGVQSSLGFPTSDQFSRYLSKVTCPAYRFEHGALMDCGPWYGGIRAF